MEAGAGVTRRAVFVQFGGVLASGVLASACGASQAANELVWRRQIGGVVSLAVSGDIVSLGAEGGGTGGEAFDAATGSLAGASAEASSPFRSRLRRGGGMVLCSGVDANGADNITAVSAATGRLLWSAAAHVGNPNNGAGPLLIFADGAVYALIGLPGSHAVYRDDVVLALDGRRGPAGNCGAARPRAWSRSSR